MSPPALLMIQTLNAVELIVVRSQPARDSLLRGFPSAATARSRLNPSVPFPLPPHPDIPSSLSKRASQPPSASV